MADAVAAPPKLKFLDAVLYTLAVGTGLRWIAVAAAVGPASLPLWLLAMFTFLLPLNVATAELSARFEGEGGIYAWTRDTYGPLAGFVCGWFYWISLMPYFAGILYFLGGLTIAAIGADPKDTTLYLGVSVAISLLVTGVQVAGLRYGKWLPNLGTAGSWIVFAAIAAMGIVLFARGQGATNFLTASYRLPMNFDTAILWGTIVFAFAGSEALGFLRNEVEGGMRTIARALAIAGVGTTLLYIAGTVAFLVILPQGELTRLAGFPDALHIGLARVGFAGVAPGVIGLFALTMLGGFTAWFGVGARLPFAAGIDAFLPPVFGWRHPKSGAPIPAILLQAAIMLALVVLSQAGTSVAAAYDFLVAMSVLTVTIPYVFMFAVYLKTAKRTPVAGAWAPPGGRRTTLMLGWVGQISTLVAIACSVVPSSSDPHPLAAFLKIVVAAGVMLGVGLVLYWLAGRRRRGARVSTLDEAVPPPASVSVRTFFGEPRALAYLAFTEAWERFSYYGMTAILVLYMSQALLVPGHIEHIAGFGAFRAAIEAVFGPMSTLALTSQIYGLYTGFVYFTPVFGGLIADRLTGRRTAVVLGAVLMSAGHIAMAFDVSFLLALLLLILGCGLLKGNISTQVGTLYAADDSAGRTRGFSIFSMGINVGAMVGPLLCGLLAQLYGWHAGFGLAGILMLFGLATYLSGYRLLSDSVQAVSDPIAAPPLERTQWRVIAALFAVMALTIFHSVAYYQNSNVALIWIDRSVDLDLLGWRMPVAWFNSIDPFISIVSVPLLFALWRRQAARGGEPGEIIKIATGAFIACAANLTLVAGCAMADRVPVLVPVVYDVLLGVAFLYYWPTLLALVSRTAPPRIRATLMGTVFLTLFLSNVAVGRLGGYFERMTPLEFWALHAAIAAVGGMLALLLNRPLGRVLEQAQPAEG